MIGFLGAGNMAFAIAAGVTGKFCKETEIGLYDPNVSQYARFGAAKRYADPKALLAGESIVFFSVKPQILPALLESLSGADPKDKLFVSICAGISTDYIRSFLPGAHVVRAMPNTPMLYSKGVCALAKGADVTDEEFSMVRDLFSALGMVLELKEEQLNEVIALNGSSPAYLFYLARAMANKAVESGFSYDESVRVIARVFEGAAEMLLKSGKSPDELCEMVCSPGGTTLEAIRVFDQYRFDQMIAEAMDACTRRAKELSQ